MPKWLKIIVIIIGVFVLLFAGLFIYLNSLIYSQPQTFTAVDSTKLVPQRKDDSTWTVGNNYLQKVDSGMYILYVEGDAIQRGEAIGALTAGLHKLQEEYFIKQIKKIVPSDFYLKFLRYFIAYFNRDIEQYIPKEYLQEIYHESRYMSSEYDDLIGPPYMRILNYHAAHDIGHALQDKHFVTGCTSFGVWGKYSADNKLMIGRNFDFYVGDDFARNKLVIFMKPTQGIPFAMVSWPGMIGAVSGMNEAGITVTINAAKSSIPLEAKTPVSIVCREILQYAHSLDEAKRIAARRQMFVSESVLVGSGSENRAIIIEKSPDKLGIYSPKGDRIICSNHFQSSTYSLDSNNTNFRYNSSSNYRHLRLEELLDSVQVVNADVAASILRNPYGLHGVHIGWGNEKALDQLIAHHSVIMEPASMSLWVSTNPFQLGQYLYFNLNRIFLQHLDPYIPAKNIAADSTLIKEAWLPYRQFKNLLNVVRSEGISPSSIKQYVHELESLNPDYFLTYETIGDMYQAHDSMALARSYYRQALGKVFPVRQDSLRIVEKLNKMNDR
jgi:predicted choloylglycine hydrolase